MSDKEFNHELNHECIVQFMDEITSITEQLEEEKYTVLARFLAERVGQPESFVVMLGETSSGKSTIINSLMDKPMLHASASPTTGTVVEIMDGAEPGHDLFYKVQQNATLSEITRNDFNRLSQQPNSDMQRLRLLVPQFPRGLKGMRLFDTPGYGSLFEEHDEVLKDFIPNGDIVIYIVSYRIGLKENDHEFLQYIQQILPGDTEFLLVINRVPAEANQFNPRIKEIVQYAEECLHRSLQPIIIHSVVPVDGEGEPQRLPDTENLWHQVRSLLNSPTREHSLLSNLVGFQRNLLQEITIYLEQQIASQVATLEEKEALQALVNEFLENEAVAVSDIEVTFVRVEGMLDKLFISATEAIETTVDEELSQSNQWTEKEDYVNFVQVHLLPSTVQRESRVIVDYIQDELEQLNSRLDSLINTAQRTFEANVALRSQAFDKLIRSIGQGVMQRAAGLGLTGFFKQFGGAGGAGAGVANAAKKGLKAVGDLFGKTFSRDTHNALASFLKRIGATSTRGIMATAQVLVEVVMYLYDVATWRSKLKGQVHKAVKSWSEETLKTVKQDMNELKLHNLAKVKEYFEGYRITLQPTDSEEVDIQTIQDLLHKTLDLSNQIDYLLKDGVRDASQNATFV